MDSLQRIRTGLVNQVIGKGFAIQSWSDMQYRDARIYIRTDEVRQFYSHDF